MRRKVANCGLCPARLVVTNIYNIVINGVRFNFLFGQLAVNLLDDSVSCHFNIVVSLLLEVLCSLFSVKSEIMRN